MLARVLVIAVCLVTPFVARPCRAEPIDSDRAIAIGTAVKPMHDPATLVIKTAAVDQPITAPPGESCFAIDRVVVSNLTLLDFSSVQDALLPLAQPCLGNTLVKAMLTTLNGLYAGQGYITTQAYLPKQDLKSSRELRIVVKEGRVASVVYEEAPAWSQGGYVERLRRNAVALFSATSLDQFFGNLDRLAETIDDPIEAPLIANPLARTAGTIVLGQGDVLEIEAMQQGLDQLNRNPSSRAKAKLEPGPEPSTSVIKVSNDPTDSFRVVAGYDTFGTRATGVERARLEIARDNLIGINDAWKTSLTSARNSNEVTGNVSVPVHWFTLTGNATYSETLIVLAPAAELFLQNASASVSGTATVERTPQNRTDVTVGIKASGNNRYINSVLLTPQKFVAAEFGVTRSYTLGQSGMLTMGGKGSYGLDAWGATADPVDANDTTPRSQYRKVEGTIGLQWSVIDGIGFSSNLVAQWTNTPLYSVEQLMVGSTSTVRGFKDAPLSGDQGGHTRNELSFRLPVDIMLRSAGLSDYVWLENRLKGLEGFAFADGGYGADLANNHEDLIIGTGLGMRYRDDRITSELTYGYGLYRMNPVLPAGHEIYLNVSMKAF